MRLCVTFQSGFCGTDFRRGQRLCGRQCWRRCGQLRTDAAIGEVASGLEREDLMWCDIDMRSYHMMSHDMTWYDMILLCVCVFPVLNFHSHGSWRCVLLEASRTTRSSFGMASGSSSVRIELLSLDAGMQIELRSWTFQQVLRIFKATIQLKSAWTVNFNDVFWCMLLRKRGLALLAASPPDGKQKPPRKTGKCSRRKGVTSIQFSLMLNANPVQLLSCDHFDVRIPGICRPKVSPGATFHTFSGNFSPFTSTVICLQSLQ